MLEREITDVGFIQRWSIVRTLMPQNVAEHSWLVSMYSNDICHLFGLGEETQLAVLKYALWHDVDEQFTGDLPGPNKRSLFDAMGPGAEQAWKARIRQWMDKVFPGWYHRSGGHDSHINSSANTVKLVVKAADWLEAAVRMATESQMGNANATRHIKPNLNGCLDTLHKLYVELGGTVPIDEIPFEISTGSLFDKYNKAIRAVCELVTASHHNFSRGPWITGEDDNRTYHEHCVD